MDSRWDGTGPAEDLALASVHCSCAPRASSSARFPEAFFKPPPPPQIESTIPSRPQ